MTGKFIVFEGIDGAGKSTQLSLLQRYLGDKGYDVVTTREPGGTLVGEEIRSILLNPRYKDLHYRTEAFLYSSARSQLVATKIKPALMSGKVVLCDRFVDSTLAYQGYGRQLSLDFLRQINRLATNGLEPDLVLIFDLLPEKGMQRVNKRSDGDRLENEPLQFHRRVRQGYLTLAEQQPSNHLILDASLTVEMLHQEVVKAIEGLLNANF